jgi:hypothetical protein
MRSAIAAVSVVLAASTPLAAQDMDHMQHAMPATSGGTAWTWRIDGNVFAGFNYQYRKYKDFNAIESQNWMMVMASRQVGPGRLSFTPMFSLEALTLKHFGSPQAFQTGETIDGAPLIDSQHPHDVFMNLGGRYDWTWGRARLNGGAYAVGEATFGPTVFMHRASAEDNPQVPLGHHLLDSSHITPGVVRGGVGTERVGIEASWFHGHEPDEHRWDLDTARLDSWAVRGTARVRGWDLQVSGGQWWQPEPNEFFNVTKLSASASFTQSTPLGPVATTVAWGRDRGFYSATDAYLAEAEWQASPVSAGYLRAELVDKNILSAGFHSLAFSHPHIISRVGALTLGYRKDIGDARFLRVGIGGDVTGYLVPDNLADPYGQPWSFHVFVRVRPARKHEH